MKSILLFFSIIFSAMIIFSTFANGATTTTLGTNGATFVSQNVPSRTMCAGSFQNISVTMRNSGTSIWTYAAGYKLGSQNPRDNTNWGLARVNLASSDSIGPGTSKVFTFTIKAPANPGTYNLQWQMLRENVAWFGNATTNIPINVVSCASTTTRTTINSITLTSPNGGEVWQRGTTHTVTWTYTGSISGHYVKLSLLKAGTEIGTIVESTPIGSSGSGSYVWNIYSTSSYVGNDFIIRVQSLNQTTLRDDSNRNFTLTPVTTTTIPATTTTKISTTTTRLSTTTTKTTTTTTRLATTTTRTTTTITPTTTTRLSTTTTRPATTTTRTTTTIAGNLSLQGVQIFPKDHILNTPIDSLPLDSHSRGFINTIGNSSVFTFYFGFPYNVVDSTQAKQRFASIERLAYSDDVPFPIPQNPAIETLCADRHMLIIDKDSRMLYESYMTNQLANGSWTCGATSVWNLSNYSFRKNNASPMWSVDAAGLPLFPALLRYDEVASGSINHTIRFTITAMRGDYVWNARASAPWGKITDPNYPPAGQRFRLKASVNISKYPPQARVILTALKKYGIIVADNGGPFALSGVPDSRWNTTDIYTLQNPGPLQLHASDFEAVDVSSLMINKDSCQARTTITATTTTRISTTTTRLATTTTRTTTTYSGTGYLSDWSQNGTDMLPLLPPNHIARVNISALPLDSRSSTWVNAVATHGNSVGYLKAYMLLNIQYVGTGVPMKTFYFDRETPLRPSDHVPYALPIDYMPELTSSDSKMMTLNRNTRVAYEMSYVDNCMSGEPCTHPMGRYPNGTYVAGGGIVYALSNLSVHTPLGTSGVIVSGMQQLPLMLSKADIASGSLDHAIALSFYAPGNTNSATDYMWPASATAYSSSYPANFPKHGARVRLKASYNISGFSHNNQIVLQGLKTYGGFFTITSGGEGIRIVAEKDALTSADNNQLMAAGNALLKQLEFVNESSLMISPTSYEARTTQSTTTTTRPVTTTTVTGIILTSPNGGEIWQRGTKHTVTWTYTGAISGHYVKLVLLKAGTEIGTIVESTPIGSGGSGSYVWDIYAQSTNVGSDMKVRVQSINQSTIRDESNGNFTLTLASSMITSNAISNYVYRYPLFSDIMKILYQAFQIGIL